MGEFANIIDPNENAKKFANVILLSAPLVLKGLNLVILFDLLH